MKGICFFIYVSRIDGNNLRSFIRGKVTADDNHYVCECTTGESNHRKEFHYDTKVWA